MAEQFRFIFEKSGSMEIYLPWQMVFTLQLVYIWYRCKYFTKPVEEDQLDLFYALTRTPVKKAKL
jgi:hypothetical protein